MYVSPRGNHKVLLAGGHADAWAGVPALSRCSAAACARRWADDFARLQLHERQGPWAAEFAHRQQGEQGSAGAWDQVWDERAAAGGASPAAWAEDFAAKSSAATVRARCKPSGLQGEPDGMAQPMRARWAPCTVKGNATGLRLRSACGAQLLYHSVLALEHLQGAQHIR